MPGPSACIDYSLVQGLAEKETWSGHRQNVYADTYKAMLPLAMKQLT